MVDLLDLITYALVSWEDHKLLFEREFWNNETSLAKHQVSVMANLSLRNDFVCVTPGTPLRDVVRLFSQHGGLHRVCITHDANIEDRSQLLGLVSQTDVIRFLVSHFAEFAAHLKGATVEAQWACKKLVSVKPDTLASVAFETLVDQKVSAVPVLDDQGRLLTSFSASDLRGMEPGNIFRHLQEPVVSFLRHVEVRRGYPERAQISCRLGDKLVAVMEKMLHFKIHRVWVVDERNVAIGIVSLTDVFTRLSE